MRLFRYLFLAALILGATSLAQANTVNDPRIIINDGLPGTIFLGSEPFLLIPAEHPSSCFDTMVGGMPSITCVLANASGGAFTSIAFDFFQDQGPLCLDNGNGNGCTNEFGFEVAVLPGNHAILFFDGLINNPQVFEVHFVGFQQGTEFLITTNVPEPGTVALFLTGLGALALRRRLQKALRSGG